MGWLDNLYDSIFSENGESDYNSEERFSYREREQPNRRVSSGWADYENFVGGPIKIVNNSRQSEIQCYRPGMVYSGAQHSEYTPDGTFAISAYWSGDVLYAQLNNNQICEWYSPGCPILR